MLFITNGVPLCDRNVLREKILFLPVLDRLCCLYSREQLGFVHSKYHTPGTYISTLVFSYPVDRYCARNQPLKERRTRLGDRLKNRLKKLSRYN